MSKKEKEESLTYGSSSFPLVFSLKKKNKRGNMEGEETKRGMGRERGE